MAASPNMPPIPNRRPRPPVPSGSRSLDVGWAASELGAAATSFVMNHRSRLLLAVVVFMAVPQNAWANAGTPLMWAGMIHLVVGNAVIGVLEGLLLGWLFCMHRGKAIGAMIAANYASAWLGGLFIRGAIVEALPMDLTNGWFWFWFMVVATYGLTLLLEWPFIAWGLQISANWLMRSIRASFLVQGASYVLLFGWYWMASGTSLYTKMHIVAPQDLSLPESVLVYFIAPSDGHVYRRNLRGGDEHRIGELHSTDENDGLLVRPQAADTNRWDLMARLETTDRRKPRFVPVLTNLMVEAAADWGRTHTDAPDYEGTWFNCGEVQALGGATNGQWKFWAGFWPVEGLRASRKETGEYVRFSYETPRSGPGPSETPSIFLPTWSCSSWAMTKSAHLIRWSVEWLCSGGVEVRCQ